MPPNDTMPVIPYPAFLVGRYASEAMALLREIEAEKGIKPVDESLPIESATPPNMPKTAMVETTRTTETAVLSSLSDTNKETQAVTSDLTSVLDDYTKEEDAEKKLDIYT